jgi:hypothetical protein
MADVLIATPVHGGQVTTHYAESLARLMVEAAKEGVKVRHAFVDSALVGWARNAFATAVLERPAITHMLFVDADIGFQPSAVWRMLAFDKPFVGCLYPARSLGPDRKQHFVVADRLMRSPDGALMQDGGGFARTERLGMGLTLLRRDVLEALSQAHPELWAPADRGYKAMGAGERVFQPFNAYTSETGLDMSEDMSFCRRWCDLGGEIWACLDEPLTHVGQMAFSGAFAESLR